MKEITINPQQIAACGLYCGACKKFLNSDRAACIRYIRENGEDAFAEKMAKDQQMTMKRE